MAATSTGSTGRKRQAQVDSHNRLVNRLQNEIGTEKAKAMQQFVQAKLNKNLDSYTVRDMLKDLTDADVIQVGQYMYLKEILSEIGLKRLTHTVEETEEEIRTLSGRKKVAEGKDSALNHERTPSLDPMSVGGARPKQKSKKKKPSPRCKRCADLQVKVKPKERKSKISKQAHELVLRKIDEGLTKDVLQNTGKRQRMIDDLLRLKAELVEVQPGCILLTVRFDTLDNLTYFWSKYKDGTVTAALSDILLSDEILEISREYHVEFYITCDISEDAYVEARRILEDEAPVAVNAMRRLSFSEDDKRQDSVRGSHGKKESESEAWELA